MKKKQLIAAAKELNDVLGLDPPIDVGQKVEDLKEEISVAAELVEPDDELSENTQEVIDALLEEGEETDTAPEPAEEEAEEEVEPDTDDEELDDEAEDEDEDEESPPEPEKKSKGGKGKGKGKAAKEKPAKEKSAAKEKSVQLITRMHAIGIAIREAKGNNVDIAEVAEAADEIFAENGGRSNPRESKTMTRAAIHVLVGFGAIEFEGNAVR